MAVRSIDIGAGANEQFNNIVASFERGEHEGGIAAFVADIGARARLQQATDDIGVAVECGPNQRRVTAAVDGVDISASFNQTVNSLSVALLGGAHQQGAAIVVSVAAVERGGGKAARAYCG